MILFGFNAKTVQTSGSSGEDGGYAILQSMDTCQVKNQGLDQSKKSGHNLITK